MYQTLLVAFPEIFDLIYGRPHALYEDHIPKYRLGRIVQRKSSVGVWAVVEAVCYQPATRQPMSRTPYQTNQYFNKQCPLYKY